MDRGRGPLIGDVSSLLGSLDDGVERFRDEGCAVETPFPGIGMKGIRFDFDVVDFRGLLKVERPRSLPLNLNELEGKKKLTQSFSRSKKGRKKGRKWGEKTAADFSHFSNFPRK